MKSLVEFLKEVIVNIVMPFPLFIIASLLCAYFSCKKGVLVCVLVLLVMSTPFVGQLLLKPFEFYAPKLDENKLIAYKDKAKFIWVLGCRSMSNERLPIEGNLHQCSLARNVQAIRLAHRMPSAKLIFTGPPANKENNSNAQLGASLARQLGVEAGRVTVINNTINTKDEAYIVRQLVGDELVVAVSSASHMPRLEYIGKKANLNLLLSPSEYLTGYKTVSALSFIPSASGLAKSERAIYEFVGNLWYRLAY